MIRDTLAERHDRMMTRIGQITRAGYQVDVQWECVFDEEIVTRHPELKTSYSTTQSSEHWRYLIRGSN